MATPLKDKVAIITGGSKGIGRATTLTLAKAGAAVVVNYASDTSAANEVVQEIGTDRSLAVRADASTLQGAETIVNATMERFGRVDVVVANAARFDVLDLTSTTEKDFDAAFRMNVKGPYFLAQKAAPYMESGGRIVFVSSTQCHASTVTGNYLLYCATKGAIEQMTRVLSKDLARKGVLVNAIAPGPTSTEMFLNGKSDELVRTIASWNPQNRLGSPEEVAEVVLFLSGDASSWMSGQVLRVNGGMA